MNVAKNALESMKNGGKLVIQIEHDQEKAQIIVKDIGEGIPQEMMESIFQPFVTSKEKEPDSALSCASASFPCTGNHSYRKRTA